MVMFVFLHVCMNLVCVFFFFFFFCTPCVVLCLCESCMTICIFGVNAHF